MPTLPIDLHQLARSTGARQELQERRVQELDLAHRRSLDVSFDLDHELVQDTVDLPEMWELEEQAVRVRPRACGEPGGGGGLLAFLLQQHPRQLGTLAIAGQTHQDLVERARIELPRNAQALGPLAVQEHGTDAHLLRILGGTLQLLRGSDADHPACPGRFHNPVSKLPTGDQRAQPPDLLDGRLLRGLQGQTLVEEARRPHVRRIVTATGEG